MRESIHPNRDTLTAFIEGTLAEPEIGRVQAHVKECDFCAEFCVDLRLIAETGAVAEIENMQISAERLADRLFRESRRGFVVEFAPLGESGGAPDLPMAADNKRDADSDDRHAITLFSADPEIVLRLMSGPNPDDNYVQLIADDSALVSHVLLQSPQLGKEFVTDSNGRADLGAEPLKFTDEVKWQIKMPDAVFDLAPLKYDPDKSEHAEKVTLETDRRDKLEVTFERLTEGKRITLRLLELDGKQEFGEVKVVVATEHSSREDEIGADSSATFEIDDADATVNIRLFTK